LVVFNNERDLFCVFYRYNQRIARGLILIIMSACKLQNLSLLIITVINNRALEYILPSLVLQRFLSSFKRFFLPIFRSSLTSVYE